jgi:hypothetical protein
VNNSISNIRPFYVYRWLLGRTFKWFEIKVDITSIKHYLFFQKIFNKFRIWKSSFKVLKSTHTGQLWTFLLQFDLTNKKYFLPKMTTRSILNHKKQKSWERKILNLIWLSDFFADSSILHKRFFQSILPKYFSNVFFQSILPK